MQRDWELIRTILLRLEDLESTQDVLNPNQIEGQDEETVSYHIHLLREAGLITATESKALSGPMWAMATGLTWEGHEFIDSIRSKSAWERVKATLADKGFDITFSAVKAAAAFLVKKYLE